MVEVEKGKHKNYHQTFHCKIVQSKHSNVISEAVHVIQLYRGIPMSTVCILLHSSSTCLSLLSFVSLSNIESI